MNQKIQILVFLCLFPLALFSGIGFLIYADPNCQSLNNIIYYTGSCQFIPRTNSSLQYSCNTTSMIINRYSTSDCSGPVSESFASYQQFDTCLGNQTKVVCNYNLPVSEIIVSALAYSYPACQGPVFQAVYVTGSCVPQKPDSINAFCSNNVFVVNSYSNSTTCSGTPSSIVNTSFVPGCSNSSNSQQFCGFVAAASRSDVMNSSTICFFTIIYLILIFFH